MDERRCILFMQDMTKLSLTPELVCSISEYNSVFNCGQYRRSLSRVAGHMRVHQKTLYQNVQRIFEEYIGSNTYDSYRFEYVPGWSDVFFSNASRLSKRKITPYFILNRGPFADKYIHDMRKIFQESGDPYIMGDAEYKWMLYSAEIRQLRADDLCIFIFDPYLLKISAPDDPIVYMMQYAQEYNNILYINPVTFETQFIHSHQVDGTEIPSHLVALDDIEVSMDGTHYLKFSPIRAYIHFQSNFLPGSMLESIKQAIGAAYATGIREFILDAGQNIPMEVLDFLFTFRSTTKNIRIYLLPLTANPSRTMVKYLDRANSWNGKIPTEEPVKKFMKLSCLIINVCVDKDHIYLPNFRTIKSPDNITFVLPNRIVFHSNIAEFLVKIGDESDNFESDNIFHDFEDEDIFHDFEDEDCLHDIFEGCSDDFIGEKIL